MGSSARSSECYRPVGNSAVAREHNFQSANLDRTSLDELECSGYNWTMEFRMALCETMMNRGAEFVDVDGYYTPWFADNACRYEDFAEGTSFILLHFLHVLQ